MFNGQRIIFNQPWLIFSLWTWSFNMGFLAAWLVNLATWVLKGIEGKAIGFKAMAIQHSCDHTYIGLALVLAAPMLAADLHWRSKVMALAVDSRNNENR
jgi:hypothetical protein